MEPVFSTPQRQSQIGVLVMFFDTIRQFGRALFPLLVIWILRIDQINKLYVTGGLLLAFILVSVAAYLKYVNFTFWLDDANDEFIINEGVFNKTRTVIQVNKIQQVNINQSLIQRIIGVYALEVDTAGSKESEAKIKAVSHSTAIALKARLLENRREKSVVEDISESSETEDIPFINIGLGSLLKVGITSNYVRTIGLILAFIVTMWENMRQLIEHNALDEQRLESYIQKKFVMQSIFFVIAAIIILVLLINVIRVIVKYFNFKVLRQRGSLLLSFGLMSTKSTIIRPGKVQITTITRNYFQKKMDIVEMKIRQASSDEKHEKKSAIEIPGCNEREKEAILKLLFDVLPEKGVMLKPNFRRLVFAIFLTIVLPLCVFMFFAVKIEPRFMEFAGMIPVYVLFTLLVLVFSFRNYRLFISDRFIIKQSGAWDISHDIIEPVKIQAVSTSQLFWHKSLNIGTLTLHTAGGKLVFNLGNYDTIKKYVNLWLYEMESSDSNWM